MLIIAKFLDAARNNVVVQIPLELEGRRHVFPDTEIRGKLEDLGFKVDRIEGYSVAAIGPSFGPYAVNSAREQAILAALRVDSVITAGAPAGAVTNGIAGVDITPYIAAANAWRDEALRRGVDPADLDAAIAAEFDKRYPEN